MERLNEVATSGDTDALYECLEKNPDVLRHFDEAEFIDTPLHIAAIEGHADFAMAVMYLRPSFGRKLNQKIYSPIHLALQNGHRDLVLRLLAVDKELVRVKGKDGYTPLHLAVLAYPDPDLLVKFLIACPECIEDVTIQNETALLIAAKYAKLDCFRILVRWIKRTQLYCKTSRKHMLDKQDSGFNTALHIAALMNNAYMIMLLLECKSNKKVKNKLGQTAMEVLTLQIPQGPKAADKRETCLKLLRREGYLSYFNVFLNLPDEPSYERIGFGELPTHKKLMTKITTFELFSMQFIGKIRIMSVERINVLLVVLALILTITYQAILNPPGGVWPADNSANTATTANTRWGKSVLDNSSYNMFFIINFLVFLLTSLLTVCILQIVTNSRGITILVELLLSFLICCLITAEQVGTPADPPHFLITSNRVHKLTPLLFLPALLLFESVRFLSKGIGHYVRFFHEM
ncbi:hypothetical protein CRYUN_Cryun41cG0048100 [Craigia yunnanensis]